MIYLSPSSLTRWFNQYDLDGKLFSCPAAWNYARQWERLEPQPIAEQGIQVHQLLEGKLAPSQVTDAQVLTMFTKIAELREMLGLRVLHAEVRQEVKLFPRVVLVRIIDAIAQRKDGEIVLLDYKSTPGNGWKVSPQNIAPQSLGFQSIGYLLKPSQKELDTLSLKEWPKTILYLIGPARGPGQYFRYDWEGLDQLHFEGAASQVIHAIKHKNFPKVRGKHCLNCGLRPVCFNEPNWPDWYRKKGKAEVVPIDD